jgi:hypothetical protein
MALPCSTVLIFQQTYRHSLGVRMCKPVGLPFCELNGRSQFWNALRRSGFVRAGHECHNLIARIRREAMVRACKEAAGMAAPYQDNRWISETQQT